MVFVWCAGLRHDTMVSVIDSHHGNTLLQNSINPKYLLFITLLFIYFFTTYNIVKLSMFLLLLQLLFAQFFTFYFKFIFHVASIMLLIVKHSASVWIYLDIFVIKSSMLVCDCPGFLSWLHCVFENDTMLTEVKTRKIVNLKHFRLTRLAFFVAFPVGRKRKLNRIIEHKTEPGRVCDCWRYLFEQLDQELCFFPLEARRVTRLWRWRV